MFTVPQGSKFGEHSWREYGETYLGMTAPGATIAAAGGNLITPPISWGAGGYIEGNMYLRVTATVANTFDVRIRQLGFDGVYNDTNGLGNNFLLGPTTLAIGINEFDFPIYSSMTGVGCCAALSFVLENTAGAATIAISRMRVYMRG